MEFQPKWILDKWLITFKDGSGPFFGLELGFGFDI